MRTRLPTIGLLAVRGLALFLAAFTVIGLIGELRGRTTDLSLWWVDIRDVPNAARIALLALFAGSVGAWALVRTPARPLRWAAALVSGLFAICAVRDVVRFYQVIGTGSVQPAIGVPLSLVIALLLAMLAVAAARLRERPAVGRARGAIGLAAAAGAWAVLFPLAQMLFFGTTDYRRPADAAVVFGARVYASGQPSPLLSDRIRTGVALYQAGLTPLLVMSGGDGTDGFNEARVMRDVAIAAGVDPAAILVDPAGSSTEATVDDTIALLRARNGARGAGSLIAVSQAYHLPRIQLAFANAGIDVLTVPAGEQQPIREMPLFVAREIPAFWAYFLRVCLG